VLIDTFQLNQSRSMSTYVFVSQWLRRAETTHDAAEYGLGLPGDKPAS
jgi:hypothetical protein